MQEGSGEIAGKRICHDHFDLYQFHAVTTNGMMSTPFLERVGALGDISLEQGKKEDPLYRLFQLHSVEAAMD